MQAIQSNFLIVLRILCLRALIVRTLTVFARVPLKQTILTRALLQIQVPYTSAPSARCLLQLLLQATASSWRELIFSMNQCPSLPARGSHSTLIPVAEAISPP